MRQVPYHGNPGNACALACYTMIAQYLLPDEHITFEQLGKLADWRKGYVVWGFPVWKWMMDRGVYLTDIDVIDYELWAKEGLKGLRKTLSSKGYKFATENTYNIEGVTKQLKLAFDHPNFSYTKKKATWADVLSQFNKPGICDIIVDGRKLHRQPGFSVHRIVLIDIKDNEVIFHDPLEDNSGAYKHEPLDHIKDSFEALDDPEVARYSLEP